MSLPTNSYNASTNSGGNMPIAPAGENHVERLSVTATSGTVTETIAVDGLHSSGDRVVIAVGLPALSGVTIEVLNADSSDLYNYTTDGSTLTAVWEFVFSTSGAWEYLRAQAPA